MFEIERYSICWALLSQSDLFLSLCSHILLLLSSSSLQKVQIILCKKFLFWNILCEQFSPKSKRSFRKSLSKYLADFSSFPSPVKNPSCSFTPDLKRLSHGFGTASQAKLSWLSRSVRIWGVTSWIPATVWLLVFLVGDSGCESYGLPGTPLQSWNSGPETVDAGSGSAQSGKPGMPPWRAGDSFRGNAHDTLSEQQ